MSKPQAHPTEALKYDDVRDGPIVLTADQQAEFEKRAIALRKLLSERTIVAKYKIELMFGKARTNSAEPTPGMLSFWANGTKLHGGGDEKLYLCPGNRTLKNGCRAILLDSYNGPTGIVCPHCGTTWKPEAVIGELLFNLPMRKWAEVIHTYFMLFESHCDIYLKYAPDDIRSKTREQVGKSTWRNTQLLAKAREKRGKANYPLRNIVKDLNAGASLEQRLYAFLVA